MQPARNEGIKFSSEIQTKSQMSIEQNEAGKKPIWVNLVNPTSSSVNLKQRGTLSVEELELKRTRDRGKMNANSRGGAANITRGNSYRERGRSIISGRGRGTTLRSGSFPGRGNLRGRGDVQSRGRASTRRWNNRGNVRRPQGRGMVKNRGLPMVASPEVALAVKKAEQPAGMYKGYTDEDFDDIYLRSASTANASNGKYEYADGSNYEMQRTNDNSRPDRFQQGEERYATSAEDDSLRAEPQCSQMLESPAYMSDVQHCQSQRPVLTTAHSCLFPPGNNDPLESNAARQHNIDVAAILISNLPSVVDEDLLTEVFSRFGEINIIKLQTAIIDEKLRKCCEMRFKYKSSAANAMRFHNHYLFVGCEGTLMLPLMVSQICIDLLDSPKADYLVFSQAAVSEAMSSLLIQEKFIEAAKTVQSWFVHGECNSSNFNTFFALVSTAKGCLEQLAGSGEELRKLTDIHRQQEEDKALSLKGKCSAMEALFSACTVENTISVFSQDQRDMISNYTANVFKEVDQLEILINQVNQNGIGSKDSEENIWKEKEEERNARRLEEVKVQRLTEENLDLKSRVVSLEIERDKLVWVINELEKQLENKTNDRDKEKDKQIEALNMQLEGLKQFFSYGGQVKPRDSRDSRRRKDYYDNRENRKENEGRSDKKTDVSKTSSSQKEINERRERKLSQDRSGSHSTVRREKSVKEENNQKPSISGSSTDGNSVVKPNDKWINEERGALSFTVVDEINDDSEGTTENSKDSEAVASFSDLKNDNEVVIKREHETEAAVQDVSTRPNGLVQYSDDHTSVQGAAEENVSKESEAEEKTMTEAVTLKRKATELSKVGEIILKRIKPDNLSKTDAAKEIDKKLAQSEVIAVVNSPQLKPMTEKEDISKPLTEDAHDALLCSVLSIALNTYPSGALLDDLKAYCESNNIKVTADRILCILKKFPNMFACDNIGKQNARWMFKGFQALKEQTSGL